MTEKKKLTAERLRELLHYDPESGKFTWSIDRGRRFKRGQIAGCLTSDGYIKVRIDGTLYQGHRLAFLSMTGNHPGGEIDHIDGNRSNNAWSNLRDVAGVVNKENQRVAKSNSKSGILGVTWFKPARLWRATIQVRGKHMTLGYFQCKHQAGEAYLLAKRRMHEGCTI